MHGRGHGVRFPGRFEKLGREAEPIEEFVRGPGSARASEPPDSGDDWGDAWGAPLSPKTVLREETARTLIMRNTSPDVPFDQSLNPYRGCEHGCVYCYARP